MKATVKIIKEAWTGWSKEQPKAEEYTVELSETGSIAIVQGVGNPMAEVVEVNPNAVTIKTSGLVLQNPGEGITLKGVSKDVLTEVQIGESKKFSTPTMDAGVTFTFELLNVGA